MPARPSNISGVQDLLNVVNQSVREMTIRIDNLNKVIPIHRVIKTSATLNFGSIPANSTVERSASLSGAMQQGSAHASPQLTLGSTNLVWSAYIPSSNIITVRVLNPTASPITVNTVKWNVGVIQ